MAGWTFKLVAGNCVRKPVHTPYQQLDPRPPTIAKPVMNNSG
jgi:hypothetical protein